MLESILADSFCAFRAPDTFDPRSAAVPAAVRYQAGDTASRVSTGTFDYGCGHCRTALKAAVNYIYWCACGLWAGFFVGPDGALAIFTSKLIGNCLGG